MYCLFTKPRKKLFLNLKNLNLSEYRWMYRPELYFDPSIPPSCCNNSLFWTSCQPCNAHLGSPSISKEYRFNIWYQGNQEHTWDIPATHPSCQSWKPIQTTWGWKRWVYTRHLGNLIISWCRVYVFQGWQLAWVVTRSTLITAWTRSNTLWAREEG